jgi:sec-independent protein translocase protein TatC
MIRLRLALYAGVVVSLPVWAWPAARFVGPALLSGEKRRTVPFLVAALLLFGAGTVFGYQLLGLTVQVLVRMFPPQIEYVPSATDYLSFSAFFLLACGMAFELPCVLVLLVSLKVIRAESLRRKRKVAWFILFAFAQVVTPVADPIVAPLTVMVPLVLLYEGSVLVAWLIEARRGRSSPPKIAS